MMKTKLILRAFALLLAAVSLLGLHTAALGVRDALDIKEQYALEKEEALEKIEALEADIEDLREREGEYIEGVQNQEQGRVALALGQAALDQGYSAYYTGLNMYNQGLAQYNAGVEAFQANLQAYGGSEEIRTSLGPIYQAAKDYIEANGAEGIFKPPSGSGETPALDEETLAAIEEGRAQLKLYEEGMAQLREAESALTAGRTQLNGAKHQLDKGAEELAASKQKLAQAKSKLREYEESENEAAKKLDELLEGAALMSRDGESTAVKGVTERLSGSYSYWKLDRYGEEVLKNGQRFLDLKACLAACRVGREYIADREALVKTEVTTRIVVSAAAALACLFALAAALLGLKAKGVKVLGAASALGMAAFIIAAAANIHGLMNGYTAYVFALGDGAYAGDRQVEVFVSLTAAALIFSLIALISRRAARRALVPISPLEDRLSALERENAELREILNRLSLPSNN